MNPVPYVTLQPILRELKDIRDNIQRMESKGAGVVGKVDGDKGSGK